MKLTTNIVSLFNPGYSYGNKGDEVTMVSTHDNICIVEAVDGNRFSVDKKYLTADVLENENLKAVPGTAAKHKPIINRAQVSKKVAPLNQNTLWHE